MRCFLALDLPVPVYNYLGNLARGSLTKGEVKLVHPDQMHVTLVFAGEAENHTMSALRAAVESVELEPMSFSLDGLGCFPFRGEPRVIWAGLRGDLDLLEDLQEDLAELADEADIPRDRRPFHAHVTLGRVKSPFGAYAIKGELEEVGPTLRDKPFETQALSLYTSELTPQGPIYTRLLERPIGE